MSENQSDRIIPEPAKLYDRASLSAKETRQAITAMSTGSLALFFLALTTKIEPLLTIPQRLAVLVALALMAIAIFAGLWSAQADARWSYGWGREVEKRRGDTVNWEEYKDYWHKHKLKGENWCFRSFAAGVFVAAVYIVLRVIGL
jgi:hypothetical protein